MSKRTGSKRVERPGLSSEEVDEIKQKEYKFHQNKFHIIKKCQKEHNKKQK